MKKIIPLVTLLISFNAPAIELDLSDLHIKQLERECSSLIYPGQISDQKFDVFTLSCVIDLIDLKLQSITQ